MYDDLIAGAGQYGAQIFHTNLKTVWDCVNRFAVFNRFTNSPVANCRGELFSLPFNKMWGGSSAAVHCTGADHGAQTACLRQG